MESWDRVSSIFLNYPYIQGQTRLTDRKCVTCHIHTHTHRKKHNLLHSEMLPLFSDLSLHAFIVITVNLNRETTQSIAGNFYLREQTIIYDIAPLDCVECGTAAGTCTTRFCVLFILHRLFFSRQTCQLRPQSFQQFIQNIKQKVNYTRPIPQVPREIQLHFLTYFEGMFFLLFKEMNVLREY